MNVPNHEKKAFCDMTPEERSAIVEAWIEGNAEMYAGYGNWMYVTNFDFGIAYRTRPRQLVIPWEHIKPEYKWAAMGRCNEVKLFIEKPKMDHGRWISANCGGFNHLDVLRIDKDGIDWRESLTARPEGV